MNLREAIGEYAVRYAQCQEVIGWEGEGAERIRQKFGESVDRLCRVVEVAEAAMAYAEYQASNPGVEAKDYFRERCRLWDAFMAAYKAVKAFEKAKEDCKSPAGEGET